MSTASNFTAQDYTTLLWARDELQQQTVAALGDTLLLFPTTVITARDITALELDDDYFKTINLLTLRNTMLGNYLETPGVSLPAGRDKQGLPAGILVSAAMDQDDWLLRVAKTIHAAISD